MAWARIDDKFLDNPKIRKAGKEPTYLYISALVYASNQLTEGFVSDGVLGLVAYKGFIKNELAHAKTLVNCGLWDRVEGGYQIHDFLKYNPTRAEIDEARAKKQFAGSKGAKVRWQSDSKSDSKPIAGAIATASNFDSTPIAERWQSHSINPSPTQLKEQEGGGGVFSDIYNLFDANVSKITPRSKILIDAAIETHSDVWVKAALEETIRQSKHSWAYCEGILKRWKAQGYVGSDKTIEKPRMRKLRSADGETIEVPA